MKVGLLLDDTLDTPDGVQQYVLTLGRWLSAQGHEVHYLVGQSKRKDLQNLHSLGRVVRLKFNGNRVGTPLPARKSRIRRLLSDLELDVIHVQMPYSPFLAGRVIKAAPKSTRIIGSFHVLPVGWLESFSTRALRLLLRGSLARIDCFIANTQNTAIFYDSAWGVQSLVIPNPVSLSAFSGHQHIPMSPKTVVFLGRFVERKGAINLIKAIDLIKDDTDAMFSLGGKGPLLQKAADLVAALGLEGRISLDGFIDEAEKANYLARADIAIFPSTGGESFGISLIEPIAAGTPIVLAGRNLGYESVLGRYEDLMFRANEPRDIADSLILWLKADKKTISDMTDRLRSHVQQYDIDSSVGPKIIKTYHDVG